MQISATTKINDLLNSYPDLVDFFIGKSPKFKHLKNPMMRKTIAKVATLKQVAEMGNLNLELLLTEIEKEIRNVSHKTDSQFKKRKPAFSAHGSQRLVRTTPGHVGDS